MKSTFSIGLLRRQRGRQQAAAAAAAAAAAEAGSRVGGRSGSQTIGMAGLIIGGECMTTAAYACTARVPRRATMIRRDPPGGLLNQLRGDMDEQRAVASAAGRRHGVSVCV